VGKSSKVYALVLNMSLFLITFVHLVIYFLTTGELKHLYMYGQLNPTAHSLSYFRSSVPYGRTI
jgi:hypothetical protein